MVVQTKKRNGKKNINRKSRKAIKSRKVMRGGAGQHGKSYKIKGTRKRVPGVSTEKKHGINTKPVETNFNVLKQGGPLSLRHLSEPARLIVTKILKKYETTKNLTPREEQKLNLAAALHARTKEMSPIEIINFYAAKVAREQRMLNAL